MENIMKFKKITLAYVSTYLFMGGIGLAFLPDIFFKLFFSNGSYGDIMPRVVGMFMIALSALIFRIVQLEDFKYYLLSIYIRTGIVVFLFFLYFRSNDPFFMVINVIVLAGLIPSILVTIKEKFL
jgi:hypothetical protein